MSIQEQPRLLCQIAADIGRHWPRPYFGAVPYVSAMACLRTVDDRYGADDGRTIVRYFLSNARTWRGPDARRVKAELQGLLEAGR